MKRSFHAVSALIFTLLLAISAPGSTAVAEDSSPVPTIVGTGNAAVYLTIRNEGDLGDVLVGAKTNIAERVELHDSTMDANGMAGMTPMPDGLPIPGSGQIELQPQGTHLMLVDLRDDLRLDDTFPITLTFANEGDITLTVTMATSPSPIDGFLQTSGALIFTPPWALPAPMLTPAPIGSPYASPAAYAH